MQDLLLSCQWWDTSLGSFFYSFLLLLFSYLIIIIRLGDRHGENILLDEKSGDMVHIDLNCLFWKGLTFEEPEKVPFRLTPHMVDALGVSGYEGVFRKVCEIALRVLRDNRETLMSVLEPLIYDPLVEWKIKNSSKAKQDFVQIFDTVNNYLLGHFGGILPISVEGHVHKLIGEATNPDNLSKVCFHLFQ